MKYNNLMKTRGKTKWLFVWIANENVFIISLYVCVDIYIYIYLHIDIHIKIRENPGTMETALAEVILLESHHSYNINFSNTELISVLQYWKDWFL